MNKENHPSWLEDLYRLHPLTARRAEIWLEEVGDDIRNKLSPPNNLIAMLNNYNIDYKGDDIHGTMDKLLKKEIQNTKNSVEYLKDLL